MPERMKRVIAAVADPFDDKKVASAEKADRVNEYRKLAS